MVVARGWGERERVFSQREPRFIHTMWMTSGNLVYKAMAIVNNTILQT